MLKNIPPCPPKEVESPSSENTNKGVLNGRTLTNAGEPTSINIEPDVTTSRISHQQFSTDSSKMFTTIKLERTDRTANDPVELFLKAIKKNPCCANDYVEISQDLSKGNFLEALSKKSKITPQDILLKSISLFPEEASSYYKLGITLPSAKSIVLNDGTRMSRQELQEEHIRNNLSKVWIR